MPYDTILDAIGHTPLIRLRKLTRGELYVKAEFLNPGGSVKDRVGRFLLEQAERAGKLKSGSIVVEPSSGNTGIGLSLAGVQMGYRVIVVMPENMSEERKKIIRALGGELVLTPAKKGIEGAVETVEAMAAEDERIFVPQQFENPDNPEIHYRSTAPEIWEDLGGRIDAFVAGVGSGGTLQGVAKFLKEKGSKAHIVAVEPENSAALLGREPGLHQIQGIGDGFIPAILDTSLLSDILTVTDEDAIETTRALAREEGMLVGTSSGANVWASIQMMERLGPEAVVVTVAPDRAERYFSTSLI